MVTRQTGTWKAGYGKRGHGEPRTNYMKVSYSEEALWNYERGSSYLISI